MSRSLVNTKLNSKYTAGGGGGGPSNPYTVGTIDSQTKSANGLVITGSNIVAQTADATNPGLVSTGAQTFAGLKTFKNNISLANSFFNSTESYALRTNQILDLNNPYIYFTLDGGAPIPAGNNLVTLKPGSVKEAWIVDYSITILISEIINPGTATNSLGDGWITTIKSSISSTAGTAVMLSSTLNYINSKIVGVNATSTYFNNPSILNNSLFYNNVGYVPAVASLNASSSVFSGGASFRVSGTCGLTITRTAY